MHRTLVHLSLLVGLGLALCLDGRAQQVPTGFQVDTLVSSGLTRPHDFCFLPDGRILIANSAGDIVIHAGGPLATIGTVPGVESGGERGLLSVAADPAFATNGYIYVWYSATADVFMHLDRFTCTGNLSSTSSLNLTLATASRRVVLANAPDIAGNHNGGSVRFGPDGRLYLCFGDDADGCQAQVLMSMQGKLLRMNVSALPAGGSTTGPSADQLDPGDNPLSANTDFSQLVLAYGLRNPFRMQIDPVTHNLYIADVGEGSFEELDEYVYQPGALALVNFGWPWREGPSAGFSCAGPLPPGLVDPIASVAHSFGWVSIMGGLRYRGQGGHLAFPASYEGSVFYGDYLAGEVRRVVQTGGTWSAAPAVPGQPSATNWAQGCVGFTSLQNGPDGAIYILQHGGAFANTGGTLKRIRPPATTVATASTYGAGCGTPPLGFAPDGSSRPVLGLVARATISSAPSQFGGVVIGASNLFFGPSPLPLDLGIVGMPGCSLLQSADFLGLAASPASPGTLSFELAIPSDPFLLAQLLYLQAWCLAPGANAAQALASNGITWQIGNG